MRGGGTEQRVRRKGHRLEATPLQHGKVQTQLIMSALMRPLLIYRLGLKVCIFTVKA